MRCGKRTHRRLPNSTGLQSVTADHFKREMHEEIDKLKLGDVHIKRGSVGITFQIEEGRVSAKIREKEIEQLPRRQ